MSKPQTDGPEPPPHRQPPPCFGTRALNPGWRGIFPRKTTRMCLFGPHTCVEKKGGKYSNVPFPFQTGQGFDGIYKHFPEHCSPVSWGLRSHLPRAPTPVPLAPIPAPFKHQIPPKPRHKTNQNKPTLFSAFQLRGGRGPSLSRRDHKSPATRSPLLSGF